MDEYTRKRLQEASLTLLDEFKRVCVKHDIPFFLAYGACLGAVRHQGFIPWDDDVDVFIFEHDADRIAAAMEKELDDRFFYQTPETDPGFHLTSRKLCLNGTTAIRAGTEDWDMHHGIRIDIYPLYEMSPNAVERFFQKCWAMVYFLLLLDRPPVNHGKFVGRCAGLFLQLFRKTSLRDFAKKVISKYVGKDTGVICNVCNGWKYVKPDYPSGTFGSPVWLDYEGREMPVPRDYDYYLQQFYGDYWVLPPEEDRVAGFHDTLFIDFDNSYENYRGIHYLR